MWHLCTIRALNNADYLWPQCSQEKVAHYTVTEVDVVIEAEVLVVISCAVAATMVDAEFLTSSTNLTVILSLTKDVTERRLPREGSWWWWCWFWWCWWWGWWWWCWWWRCWWCRAVHIEGGEGRRVPPSYDRHLTPPRFRRWWRKKVKRARGWTIQRSTGGGGCLCQGSLVGSCPLVATGSCSSTAVSATLTRSWEQGWSRCWRWRCCWRWGLKLKLHSGHASPCRKSESCSLTSLLQLFIELEDLLDFRLHFSPDIWSWEWAGRLQRQVFTRINFNFVNFRINWTDGIFELSGIVTTDLTVLLEKLNYWIWTVTIELLETMELMELIEPKQLMELTEFMELLESWLLLWIGGYDWIDRADGASGISGMKGGNDWYWWTCWNWWKF